jgi:hypothetical protein
MVLSIQGFELKMGKIRVTDKGVKRDLTKFDAKKAVAEYLWNGFDASATQIDINFESNEIGSISWITISDNGFGIGDRSKFEPYLESEKIDNEESSSLPAPKGILGVQGKNGVGRLTFFKFAQSAEWTTVFSSEEENFEQTIKIYAENLDEYDDSQPPKKTGKPTGTTVTFRGIDNLIAQDFEQSSEFHDFLCQQFACYLELNKDKGYDIKINGDSLNYSTIIHDSESFELKIDKVLFKVDFIRWADRPKDGYYRYYFVNSRNQNIDAKTTTFNNKSYGFHHSLYIKSSFFDDHSNPSNYEFGLLRSSPEGKVYNRLLEQLEEYLKSKIKIFLETNGQSLIDNLKDADAFRLFR